MSTSWDEVNDSLKTLSVAEQNAIRSVLEKDLEFQQLEQNRIRSLSNSIQVKKLSIGGSESSESGLSSPGNISQGRTSPLPKWNSRSCSVCSVTLGYILNSGTKCKKCSTALCDKCQRIVTSSSQQKHSLCPICFSERELSAVKNEWVQGSDEMTSEKLLSAMKTSEKRMSVQIQSAPQKERGGRAPYKRNLTLPAIQTNFLNIPDESQGGAQSANTSNKFWGGSPSPRSPRSMISSGNSSMVSVYDTTPGSETLRAVHPREPIGSPAPRPMSSTPLCGVPEHETTSDTVPVPSIERRRSAFEGTRRSGRLRRQSEAPVPTFRLSMC